MFMIVSEEDDAMKRNLEEENQKLFIKYLFIIKNLILLLRIMKILKIIMN